MKKFSIRSARYEDQEPIVACVQAAYAQYIERIGKKPAPLLANYTTLIAQNLVYVLIDEEGVRGVLVMLLLGRGIFVENVAIDPRSQGRGLGRALMAFVEQQARILSMKEISLYTNELMTENLSFYHHLGFQEEERRIEDGYRRVYLHKLLL